MSSMRVRHFLFHLLFVVWILTINMMILRKLLFWFTITLFHNLFSKTNHTLDKEHNDSDGDQDMYGELTLG